MEQCIKCGANEIKVTYNYVGKKIYWEEHKEIKNLSSFTRNDTYFSSDRVSKEFLLYKCGKCGYKQAEPPKDKI